MEKTRDKINQDSSSKKVKAVGKKSASDSASKKVSSSIDKEKATRKKAAAPSKSVRATQKIKAPTAISTLSQEQVKELVNFVVHKLDEGKAEEIISMDLTGKTSFTDYLVIATGTSSRHVMGLMNNLVQEMKKAGYRIRVSGEAGDGNWVVIDLIDVVVHLFTPETRAFYNLEEVWGAPK